MKKLISIIILLALALSAHAELYRFTASSADFATIASDISTSTMDAKLDYDGSAYHADTAQLRIIFTSTLSAGDITKLKALFPTWTPSGF